MMENILSHIVGREACQADSERIQNVLLQLPFFLFFLSPHTQYGTRKVSIIMEGNKGCGQFL